MMNLTVESGINVYLRCPASGYPILSTVWQYGGKQLFSESRHRVFGNGTLLIKQVVGNKDQGEYTCTIKNRNEQSAVGRLFLTIMGNYFSLLSLVIKFCRRKLARSPSEQYIYRLTHTSSARLSEEKFRSVFPSISLISKDKRKYLSRG